jgi:peptide/nickel transport system substrate-binding protein
VRKLQLALALVAVSAVGSVAGSVARAGSTVHKATTIPLLRVGDATGGISSLDPTRNEGSTFTGVFDTLLRFTPDGHVVPNLAQSVTRPSPATYVYHLRHGVKFWDGHVMTADDVANSLNYYRFPKFQTATFYTSVKSVVARDPYTVVVTLKRPDSSWDSTLAWQGGIFEKAFQQAHASTFGQPRTGVMATGAFEVQSLDPTSGLELTANPHWWNGPVNVKHVSEKFFADETSMALAFRAGQIDVAFPQAPIAFASAANAKLVNAGAYIIGKLAMNYHVGPFSDIHVRRAVAYALDKNAIVNIAGVPARPVTTLIPPSQLQFLGTKTKVNALVKSVPTYPFSLAKAKAEMAKSAYPNGFSTSMDQINVGARVTISEAIASQLAAIGIKLTINVVSIPNWLTLVYGPKTFPVMFSQTQLQGPDPSGWDAILGSDHAKQGGANTANYDPPIVDALIAQSTAVQNHAKRLAVYQKMLQRIAKDVAYLPLYQADSSVALASNFSWPTFSNTYYDVPWPLEIRSK